VPVMHLKLAYQFVFFASDLFELDARHLYGPKCYGPNGCADIFRQAGLLIDARRYSSDNAIWRFCAAEAFDICNGNRIDDRKPCSGAGCPIMLYCGRVALRNYFTQFLRA